MSGQVSQIVVEVASQAMVEITSEIASVVAGAADGEGVCTIFIPHTSASLVIQENADPSAKDDLERWLNRLVPEGDPLYRHTTEGPDDMPAHIKAALTATSISIPYRAGALLLGTWQGVFLWEHRRGRNERKILIHTS